MAFLGEFGAAVRELADSEQDTFTLFGETFTVVGALPSILMVQLGAAATGKIDQLEGLAAVWETYRRALGDDEFDRFFKHAGDTRADFESLFALAMKLFEAQAGRPTGEVSASSDTSPATSPNVSPISSVWESHGLRPVSDVVLTG